MFSLQFITTFIDFKMQICLTGMFRKCFLIFLKVLFQCDYEVDNLMVEASEHTLFPENYLLIT